MLSPNDVRSLGAVVETLKAAAEISRLRILVLLSKIDLNVSDITEILNQSQPRVSRHLKLLLDAGLISRYQEGAWAYFRLAEAADAREFVLSLVAGIDGADAIIIRDLERLESVRQRRQERAAEYFSENAGSWDRIRSLHAPDRSVEGALTEMIGTKPLQSMLDLGTGTGRMLELFAPLCVRAVGIDMSRDMLAVARANLERAEVANAQVRQGDVYAPPVERNNFDLVTIHQVLHYLEEPGNAIREAALALRPGGRIAVVDFAPHSLDFLREEHAHFRLGISDEQIAEWFGEAGLELEDMREIAPAGDETGKLTVKIWLGRDRRTLIAEPHEHQTHLETA
jgi:ubiquinone/menaquinone biosynthesis C-methylase UbiE